MRLLYIADFLYFTDGGAHVSACAHMNTLINMYGRKNIDIVALTGQRDDEPIYGEIDVIRGERNKFKLWINCLFGYSTYLDKNGIKRIIGIIKQNKYDVVFLDNSIFGKLAKNIKMEYPNMPLISYYHDVKASLAFNWKKSASLLKKVVYQAMIDSERLNEKYCDVNLTLNPRETKLYEEYYGKTPELELGVYMDIELDNSYKNSKELFEEELNVLFIGSHYKPNVDGIIWYIQEVLPLINIKTRLIIAGSHMDLLNSEIKNIPDNVTIMGHVEDLSLLYKDADVVISPIFDGGGMKVKVAHAVGYGKIVVGTNESFEGYQENIPDEYWNKYFYRCNTKEEFSDAIERIKNNKSLYKMNPEVRRYFEQYYSESYAQLTIDKAIKIAIDKNK